jgi:hypothetical protein
MDIPEVEVPPWLVWVWRCWHRLTLDRGQSVQGVPLDMGVMAIRSLPGRIPFSKVDEYAARRDYDEDRLDFLWRCLCEMEEEYLSVWHMQNPPPRR